MFPIIRGRLRNFILPMARLGATVHSTLLSKRWSTFSSLVRPVFAVVMLLATSSNTRNARHTQLGWPCGLAPSLLLPTYPSMTRSKSSNSTYLTCPPSRVPSDKPRSCSTASGRIGTTALQSCSTSCTSTIPNAAAVDVGTDPLIMRTLQRLRTKRHTLRRYYRRDPMDSRNNQKVRDISFYSFRTKSSYITQPFHPHHHPPPRRRTKKKKKIQVRLPRHKNARDHRPLRRRRLDPSRRMRAPCLKNARTRSARCQHERGQAIRRRAARHDRILHHRA